MKYTTELKGREDIEKLLKQIWSFALLLHEDLISNSLFCFM